MHNGRDILIRLLRYVVIWGVGFVVLCFISIIKNWDALVEVFSVLLANLFSSIFPIVLFVVIIRHFFR